MFKPSGSNVRVFVKYASPASDLSGSGMDYLPYHELQTSDDNYVSTSNFDFRELEYKVSNTTHQEMIANNIKSFVVKVCLFGEEDVPPVIKDLRVVALD